MLYNDTTYLKFQVDAQCYRNDGHSDYSFVKGIAGVSLLQKYNTLQDWRMCRTCLFY